MQHSFSDFYDAEVHSLLLVFFCVAFSSSEGLNRLGTFHWPSLQHWSSYLAAKDLLALTPLHLLATDLGLVDHKDSDSHCITWSHWCRIASYFFCQIFFRWLIASRRNLKPRAKDIFATKLQSFAFDVILAFLDQQKYLNLINEPPELIFDSFICFDQKKIVYFANSSEFDRAIDHLNHPGFGSRVD